MKYFLVVAVAVAAGAVLAYGYWHASSHASFYVTLEFEAGERKASAPRVTFLDAEGTVLAVALRDEQYNFLHLIHPEYGDCHEAEGKAPFSKDARTAWQECFEHQSTWVAGWIEEVAEVNVEYDGCRISNHPIAVSGPHSDWYFWWIPHPHIGGKPYSYYSAAIAADDSCG